MKQGITFKQPFRKSITFRTVFYSVLFLLLALIFVYLLFQIKFVSFTWQMLVVYISWTLLILEFLFLGSSLFLRSYYVVLYDDRLVCVNRFISSVSKTYIFDKYLNYKVLIYTKSAYSLPMGIYGMICFCAPGKKRWKIGDYSFIASVGAEDCTELACILGERGFDVKIYN